MSNLRNLERNGELLKSSITTIFVLLICLSCSGGNSNASSEETITGIQGGQQVVSQDIIEAAQAQRDNKSETIEEIAQEVGVLSVEEVEVALVISSSENRRLGDRIAGTIVISRSTLQEN